MSDGVAPRELGWKGIILALAAFLLVPLLPQLRAVVPVENTLLLVVPAVSACMVVGWWSGGRLSLSLAWLGLAVWVMLQPGRQGSSAYHDISRGWGILVAASFGWMCFIGRGRRGFVFHRALSATGLAMLLALVVVMAARVPLGRVQAVFADQFAFRNTQSALALQRLVGLAPSLSQWTESSVIRLQEASALATILFPALLALEALTACALAWGLYHRLSRVRLGPAMAPLREFRFSNQLLLGLIVALTIAFLPSFGSFKTVGWNLLLFFAMLYTLRGLGVALSRLKRAPQWIAAGAIVTATLFLPVTVLALFTLGVAAAASFALGVNDTWFDLRGSDGGGQSQAAPM